QALQYITPVLEQTGYQWGPTGSAGFELATGAPALNNNSDLDLVIDLPAPVTIESASLLMSSLEKSSSVPLDVQMNTPSGGVSLREFIRSEIVLVKTCCGPGLQHIQSLWY
ncbi:MAG: phosphoribosyl-dephospho-CoA transferase, partial [Sphingobacteriales bacterium]